MKRTPMTALLSFPIKLPGKIESFPAVDQSNQCFYCVIVSLDPVQAPRNQFHRADTSFGHCFLELCDIFFQNIESIEMLILSFCTTSQGKNCTGHCNQTHAYKYHFFFIHFCLPVWIDLRCRAVWYRDSKQWYVSDKNLLLLAKSISGEVIVFNEKKRHKTFRCDANPGYQVSTYGHGLYAFYYSPIAPIP